MHYFMRGKPEWVWIRANPTNNRDIATDRMLGANVSYYSSPRKRPLLEEVVNHRWLNSVDYMAKKRERASFTSNRIQVSVKY